MTPFAILLVLAASVLILSVWTSGVVNMVTGCKGPDALGLKKTLWYMWLPNAIKGAMLKLDRSGDE